MKIYSLDIETTGDNANKHDILTIGGIIAELNNGKLTIGSFFNEIFFKEDICISEYPYKIHKELLEEYFKEKINEPLVGKQPINYSIWGPEHIIKTSEEDYYKSIVDTLYSKLIWKQSKSPSEGAPFFFNFDDVLIIGKNYTKFDREFLLKALDKFGKTERTEFLRTLLNRTAYDIGTACMDFNIDTKVPNTKECLDRLGVQYDKDKFHNSLYDSYLMLQAFAKINKFSIINPLNEKLFTMASVHER